MKKKGVSTIISVLIILLIVLVAVGIIWRVILPIIEENTEYIEACGPDLIGKMEIDRKNTCYNSTDENLNIAIDIKNIELDKIIVSVSSAGETKSFDVTEDINANSGHVHNINLGMDITDTEDIDSVKISPVINSENCDAIDTINSVASC